MSFKLEKEGAVHKEEVKKITEKIRKVKEKRKINLKEKSTLNTM